MKNKTNSPSGEEILDPREMYLTVELDEGGEETFQIMKIFEVNGQDYIAVCPTDGSEDVYFFRHFEVAEGNPSLVPTKRKTEENPSDFGITSVFWRTLIKLFILCPA